MAAKVLDNKTPITRNIAYCLLQGCEKQKDLECGERVQTLLIFNGLESIAVLGDHLIRLFAYHGRLLQANPAFTKIEKPTVHTWAAIILANAKLGQGCHALQLYHKMQLSGTASDKYIYVAILKTCNMVKMLSHGRIIHNEILNSFPKSDVFMGNALVDMYAKCGSIEEARETFERLADRDVISWNAMIAAYAQHGECFLALECFQRMQYEGMIPNVVSWSTMIEGYAEHGEGVLALKCFENMQREGVEQNEVTCLSILKACASIGALQEGRLIHDKIVEKGIQSHIAVINAIITMYAKCGSLEEARYNFEKLANRDVISWCAMIAAYVQHGKGHLALDCFARMQKEGIKPAEGSFLTALKACADVGAIGYGRSIHEQINRSGNQSDVLGNALVDMYAKCGNLEEAFKVFGSLVHQSVVSWNAVISGCVQHADGPVALECFEEMQKKGIQPDAMTFLYALKACNSIGAVKHGTFIHEKILQSGLEEDITVGSTLVDMYAKCGNLQQAQNVFDKLPNYDVVPFNAMISGYLKHGAAHLAVDCYERMQKCGLKPNGITFLSILKAFISLGRVEQGRFVHDRILEDGLQSDVVLGSTLAFMYAKCGRVEETCKTFEKLPHRNEISWSAIIAGYAQNGDSMQALECFKQMQEEYMEPDEVTFLSVLKACANIGALTNGRLTHGIIYARGFQLDLVIASTLVDMYAKCGSLEESSKLFARLLNRDVVAWGAMIAGYAENGEADLALECFRDMQETGIKPNVPIYLSVLKACTGIGALDQGRLLHNQMFMDAVQSDLVVGSTLIDMYAKCSSLKEACTVFNQLPYRNVVTWGAMIAGYTHQGEGLAALECFERMQQEGPAPNEVIFLSVLKACGSIGLLERGRFIHNKFVKSGLEMDVVLGSTIVDMYTKCGSLEEAGKVFQQLRMRNVVSWCAIIGGYAHHGNGMFTLSCFEKMCLDNIKPNEALFTCILLVCSHVGLVDEGRWYLNSMSNFYGIAPSMSHYMSMADLLGRAGCLEEAEELLPAERETHILGCIALLSACRMHGSIEAGRHCFDEIVCLDSQHASAYVLMSNMYANARCTDYKIGNQGKMHDHLDGNCSAFLKNNIF